MITEFSPERPAVEARRSLGLQPRGFAGLRFLGSS
jgi:hypothetical protein